jgi:glycine dehydrogenase subunit 2
MTLIFDYHQSNTKHTPCNEMDVDLPEELKRDSLPLPDVNEIQIIRHYTELSKKNYGIDTNFYPLGSCTMKYNPRVNEDIAKLPGFSGLHPHVPTSHAQGALQVIWELEECLKEITGMDAVSLQPAAGSQCELLGVMIAKKYFAERNENRTKIIIPDSAHGTNPATAAMCKFQTVTIPTDDRGNMDINEFKKEIGKDVAVVMITNPNTLGLYEENLSEIQKIAKENGALMYCDGANMNAGFDMIHLNLHKTFSTPHGGGGPGGGALGVRSFLEDYLPVPRIKKDNEQFSFENNKEKSVGKIHSFYGNFGILVRALSYIKSWGTDIQKVSQIAVLNANYLFSLLKEDFDIPYDRRCAHEFVLSAKNFGENSTLNIAKRITDHGFHAPTIYFPLIVKEALMIEPTETESKETLDKFAKVLKTIIKELKEDPELLTNAPHTIPGRLDEVKAARELNLRWMPRE